MNRLGVGRESLRATLDALRELGLVQPTPGHGHPMRPEYLLTAAGRDFLPVLFMIGDWGRKYRGGGKLTRFVDAETGKEIQPVAVDAATGAKIGTRPIQVVAPE